MLDISTFNFEGLTHSIEHNYPNMVSGRTAHIDADFLAYMVSYEKEDDPKSTDDMKHNAETMVEHIRKMAGAQYVHMHLTPSSSNKGGRYGFAIQQPYQGNRDDKSKPRMLHIMRQWMSQRYPGTQHQFCEADDGMASAQYAAIKAGQTDLSIIASKDKDLDMVPGWHMVWDTGELIFVDPAEPFGWVELVEKKSASGLVTKKLKGYGHKWLWAQMLIGDSADNIKGLPMLTGPVLNMISPTIPVATAQEILNEGVDPKAMAKAQKILDARKPGKVGPVTAIKLLDMMHDNKQAFHSVRGLYQMYGEAVGFRHYETGADAPWGQVFLSELQMLWMRREMHNPHCVINWLQEINK